VDASVVNALTAFLPQVIPEGILALVACVLFLGSTFKPSRNLWGTIAVGALLLAGGALFWSWRAIPTVEQTQAQLRDLVVSKDPQTGKETVQFDKPEVLRKYAPLRHELDATLYSAPVLQTQLGLWVKLIALIGGLLLVWLAWDQVPKRFTAEYHACLLLITAGVSLTGSANELITLFLALELISIPTYVLLYLPRADGLAQEAAMKYFLLSIFSAGLMLFGFSYLYGLAGTTNITAIVDFLSVRTRETGAGSLGLPLVAILLVIAGLGFKITAVPFHFYAPDVYQGTPTPGAALLAFVPKVAGFVAMARILGLVTPQHDFTLAFLQRQLPLLLWILAAVTMTLGNILALLQDNIKRLLAYSSVAHAGYMLMGLAVASMMPNPIESNNFETRTQATVFGVDAVIFYLMSYGAMTVGAFAVLAWLSTPERPVEDIEDLSGAGRSHPVAGLSMTLFLLSLIGIPLTAGFMGKLLIFMGSLQVPSIPGIDTKLTNPNLFVILTVIGAINAAIGGYYYLRIIGVLYLRDAVKPLPVKKPAPVLATIGLCAVLTLAGGIYPDPVVKALRTATRGPIIVDLGVAQGPADGPAIARRE
jgi:NADH-quinone oxidoreductase subunit N